jgi:hypothetical protein
VVKAASSPRFPSVSSSSSFFSHNNIIHSQNLLSIYSLPSPSLRLTIDISTYLLPCSYHQLLTNTKKLISLEIVSSASLETQPDYILSLWLHIKYSSFSPLDNQSTSIHHWNPGLRFCLLLKGKEKFCSDHDLD